jgi:hypothetical protein
VRGGHPLIYFVLPLELLALPLFVIRAPPWMWRFLYSVTKRQKLNYAGIAPCENSYPEEGSSVGLPYLPRSIVLYQSSNYIWQK